MELRGLKKTRNQSQAVRERESCDSWIALHSFHDTDKILDPILKPQEEKVASSHGCIFVAFDLETTSLSTDSDIAQTACTIGEEKFNRYILPTKPFTSDA